MIKKGKELAEYLKAKKVVVVAGELCNKIEFDGKKLLDYAVEISNKLGATVAGAGNTPLALKEKGAKSVRKMWALEMMSYMNWNWETYTEHPPITDKKPEVLLVIGYSAPVAQSMVSTVKAGNGETVVLGSAYVDSATYSFPDSHSLKQWEMNLKTLVESL